MIAIKIFRREYQTPEILKFETFPIRLGRSVKNDIILHDDTVSAEHCILEKKEQGYFLKDLGSTNAFYSEGKKHQILQIRSGAVVWVGDLRLEFLFDDQSLDETREIIYQPELTLASLPTAKVFPLLLIFAAYVLSSALNYYHNKGLEPKISSFLAELLSTTLAVALISLVLSLLAKLQSKSYRYLNLFRYLMIVTVISTFLSGFSDFISFNLGPTWLSTLIGTAFKLTLIYWLVFQLMGQMVDRLVLKKRKLYSGALVGSMALIALLFDFLSSMESARFDYYGNYGYPLRSFGNEEQGIEDLFKKMDHTSETLGKYREEAIKELDLVH